jgi:hypothetical protein
VSGDDVGEYGEILLITQRGPQPRHQTGQTITFLLLIFGQCCHAAHLSHDTQVFVRSRDGVPRGIHERIRESPTKRKKKTGITYTRTNIGLFFLERLQAPVFL